MKDTRKSLEHVGIMCEESRMVDNALLVGVEENREVIEPRRQPQRVHAYESMERSCAMARSMSCLSSRFCVQAGHQDGHRVRKMGFNV